MQWRSLLSIHGYAISRYKRVIVENSSISQRCNKMINITQGSLNLRKTKWNSKLEHEHVGNFKVLQASFKLLNIDKVFIKNVVNLLVF